MKNYDVYGIGSALIDLEFEVTVETLDRLKIDKGIMTLIDADRERELLEELDGEKHVRACGGSAANAISVVSQLGGTAFYSCKVADDDAGHFFLQDFANKGVVTNFSKHSKQQPGVTGKCIAMITPDADRTLNTFLGISETFSEAELNADALAHTEYLYIEGYLISSPVSRIAMKKSVAFAKQHNTKISLTLSDINMVRYFKNELLEIIGNDIDLLFCNYAEAALFCETDNLDEIKQKLQQYTKQFAITLGDKGALLFDGQQFYAIAPYRTFAVDTTGAGDIFAGTFLYGITHGLDFAKAGDIASLASSKVVAKFGPRLDNLDIINLKQHVKKFATIKQATDEAAYA